MKHTRKNKTKQPYRDSRRFDYTCRNQGSCGYCAQGRKFREDRQGAIAGPAEMPLHLIFDEGLDDYPLEFW